MKIVEWFKANKKRFAILAVIPAIALMASSCDDTSSTVQNNDQATIEQNQQSLAQKVPVPQITDSLERSNVSKRLTTFEDPNKVTYIYLVSFGKVMSYYTVKGKVTSSNKRLTTNTKIVENNSYDAGNYSVVEQPGLDGTYGTSDNYIFFWTTDGTYVQWSGDYMLSDQPLKLSTPPELVRQVGN